MLLITSYKVYMKFTFIQLNNIQIPEDNFYIISPEFSKEFEIYISSPAVPYVYKNEVMNALVECSPMGEDLGKYDVRALLRKPMICVWETSGEQELQFQDNKIEADKYYSGKELRYSDLAILFSLGAWMVKDCSVYTDLYYFYNADINYSMKGRRSFQQMNASGKMEATFFDEEEIKETLNYMILLMEFAFSNMEKNEQIESVYSQETLILNVEAAINSNGKSFNRLLILLQLARKTGLLFEKVSWYCALLECLFAIERDHKRNISEMTAMFIANSEAEKIEIVQNMKQAYKVRSEFVHGSVISFFDNNEQMMRLSRKVDMYVRRALRRVFTDNNFNYDNTNADRKRVRQYFQSILKNDI